MHFSRLAKYFSGKLPNSDKMDISEFVKVLGNIDIEGDFISEYGAKFGSIKTEYESLFRAILVSENGENKIHKILAYFELSKSFIEVIDYEKYEGDIGNVGNNEELSQRKSILLGEFKENLDNFKITKNNKKNGNEFEIICEKFLLESSYFYPGFKEFTFEDGTEKIDRLLKLKKDIGNFGKETGYLGYVILEAKYKKKDESSASEVPQLMSYISRLHKYGISKYAIVITSNDYKDTYKTKIGDYCREKIIEHNPFYLSLLTIEEIQDFLGNEGNYQDMGFDEFIERSFIKWLK